MVEVKKSFFEEPTATEIMRRGKIEVSPAELNEALGDLDEKYLLVRGSLVPDEFDSHRKFLKHGFDVVVSRPETRESVIAQRKFPYERKREGVARMRPEVAYVGWSFRPLGNDRRKRRITFDDCFEAARIYAYAHQSGVGIEIKPYDDARRVKTEGTHLLASVPSRTRGEERYEFTISSAPVVDSPDKFATAFNFSSDHVCPDVRFCSLRYRREVDTDASLYSHLDAHVGAAWLQTIDNYWNESRNVVPLNCGQFDIPTERAVDFYKKLLNSVLVQEDDAKPKKLDSAGRNVAIGDQLRKRKYDWMFWPLNNGGKQGNVRDYDWSFD